MLKLSSTQWQWPRNYSIKITDVWMTFWILKGVPAFMHVCHCVRAKWMLVADVDDVRFGGSDFPLHFLLLQSFISAPPMKISQKQSQHTTKWNQASLLMAGTYKYQSTDLSLATGQKLATQYWFNIFWYELSWHYLTRLTNMTPVVWRLGMEWKLGMGWG